MKRMFPMIVIDLILLAAMMMAAGCTPEIAEPDILTPTETAPATEETVDEPTETPEPGTDADTLAVEVTPMSATPGEQISLTATGFPPNGEVDIGFGRVDSEYDVIATAQADEAGVVTTDVIVPNFAEPEDDWVFVVDAVDEDATAISELFDVTSDQMDGEPTVSVAPESGAPTSQVEVRARGFPANTEVEIGFGRVDSEYDVLTTMETDADGRLTAQVTVPDFADAGDPYVFVVSTLDHQTRAISDVFDVVQLGGGIPSVNVTPQAGAPGDPVEVTATGFPSTTPVVLGFGRVASEYDVVATAETDEAGDVLFQATVPDFAEPEDEWIWVIATENRTTQAASGIFDVVAAEAAATPTPRSDGLITRANIYLIALEDAGGMGPEVGCGDSVVPVEIQFEPTIAPLTAALNQLLTIDEEYYGQSGLYNALHQSDLQVQGINIVGGTATIALTGELQIGGVCDAPRVLAQIRQTALQFSTVNQVQILYDGTPLEQVLDGK